MSKFKIPIDTAMMHIQNLKNEIQEAYRITVHDDTSIPINSGGNISEQGLLFKQADDIQFLNNLRALNGVQKAKAFVRLFSLLASGIASPSTPP